MLWLVFAAACVAFARGALLLPAIATLAASVALSTWPNAERRDARLVGAAIGAAGIQVILRWPPQVFHGFPSLAAAVVFVVCAVAAWQRSSRRARRVTAFALAATGAVAVVLTVPLLVAALVVRNDALNTERDLRTALADVGSANSTSLLRAAASDSNHASQTIGSWYTDGTRIVPLVSQQARFVTNALRSAASATAVGAREAPAIDYRRLAYHDGKISLPNLRAMRVPIRTVYGALEVAERRLTNSTSGWLIAPLGDRAASYRRVLARAVRSASLAVQASRVLPDMLGGDGIRRYLVAFMTPAESRGYDGLIGSYGLLTALNGHVSLVTSGSITQVGDALPNGGAVLTGPADFLSRYGQFHPQKFPGNETYSPDLPTVSDVLRQVYPQSGGPPIDGVLAIDPYGLAALLRVTGPIMVPGWPVPLTSQNAAQVLLKEQYLTYTASNEGVENDETELRHDFLQSVIHVAFDRFTSGSLPAPRALSAALDPAAVTGRISFWSFHPNDQPLIRSLGIDGSFPRTSGGDLLAVTMQNVGQNKIDAYLHKRIADSITYDPSTGSDTSVVTITLHNDAPASGLPPIVIDNPGAPGVSPGVNRTWLSLYSPLSLEGMSINGAPQAMSSGKELGVNAYSAFVDVPPGATVTVRIRLSGQIRPAGTLRVSVRLQPSANPQEDSVTVAEASSAGLQVGQKPESWTLSQDMRQSRVFRFAGS